MLCKKSVLFLDLTKLLLICTNVSSFFFYLIVRHTVDIQSKYLIDGDPKDNKSPLDWNWNTEERRSSCMYQIAGPGNGKFSRAEFKVLKLYFIQQHWGILKQELGEKNVHQFDYAQYMRTVVTEEIVELLEVTPVTWGVFVVFLWVVYGVWSGVLDYRYDNGLTLVSVMLAWALFGLVLLLVVESHRGMQRLHAQVAECFNVTTESNALEETFKKLSEKWLCRFIHLFLSLYFLTLFICSFPCTF